MAKADWRVCPAPNPAFELTGNNAAPPYLILMGTDVSIWLSAGTAVHRLCFATAEVRPAFGFTCTARRGIVMRLALS
jgi:hypothetical protein